MVRKGLPAGFAVPRTATGVLHRHVERVLQFGHEIAGRRNVDKGLGFAPAQCAIFLDEETIMKSYWICAGILLAAASLASAETKTGQTATIAIGGKNIVIKY